MKFLFYVFCLAIFGLEATHLQTSTHVTSLNQINDQGEKTYLVEFQIEKISNAKAELVACPKLMCIEGHPSQIHIGSENQADLLFIEVLIPKISENKNVQTSIFMKENNQTLLHTKNVIELDNL